MDINKFFRYFTERNKLSMRNIRTDEEMWHVFTSRINIILAGLMLILLLFIFILTVVAYTPILDLIPGYPGNKSRRVLLENIQKLDSLEQQVAQWEGYQQNLTLILDGQSPLSNSQDTLHRVAKGGTSVARSISDSLLRHQIKNDSSYMLSQRSRKLAELTFEMIPPVKGLIVSAFNPKNGIYGIELTPAPGQPVMAVLDGTIILDSWNPTSGYMIVIEHSGNMISVYKNVSRTIRKTGERVRAGEAIAITAANREDQTSQLVFELWYNGNAIDPENYIAF